MGLAFAAGLKGLELVKVFEEEAMEVGLVALEALHIAFRRKGAGGQGG